MNRIKVVGGLVFALLIILAILSISIVKQNRENSNSLSFIHEQKAFTQEISKSIFYIYKNGDNSPETLDKTIKKYIENVKINESEFSQNEIIATLWNIFYADVQKFRNQQKISTGYNSVITAKLVNRIYHNNVLLVNEFDKFIEMKQVEYHENMEGYKKLQYLLFFTLIGLFIYLFTKIRVIIGFIQKFSKTSKNIIENSTIQGLKPMEEIEQEELKEATKNYNHLVEKINSSINYSSQSMGQTTESLEKVAENIEDFMELLSTMQEDESEALFEKEDAVIDSLEGLMRLRKKLKHLQRDLDSLISSKS
jgi:methyl-accepting chemotaxis protein